MADPRAIDALTQVDWIFLAACQWCQELIDPSELALEPNPATCADKPGTSAIFPRPP